MGGTGIKQLLQLAYVEDTHLFIYSDCCLQLFSDDPGLQQLRVVFKRLKDVLEIQTDRRCGVSIENSCTGCVGTADAITIRSVVSLTPSARRCDPAVRPLRRPLVWRPTPMGRRLGRPSAGLAANFTLYSCYPYNLLGTN